MKKFVGLVVFMTGLLVAAPAFAVCPDTLTDCPSPHYNVINANNATIGADTGTQSHVDLNGANGANRTFRLRTAGSSRWSFGTGTTPESAPATTTTTAAVASGNTVVPISSNAGIASGMQVIATGVPSTAYVVSTTGGSPSTAIAVTDTPSGSTVVTVNDSTGIAVGASVAATNVPGSSVVVMTGGSGTNPSTTASVTSTSDTQLHVVSIANIVAGMKAVATGIQADTYVTSVLGVPNVVVYLSKPASVTFGTTVTFNTAFVMSGAATGTVANGSQISFLPNMVISQPTISPGVSSGDAITFYPNTGTDFVFTAQSDVGATRFDPLRLSRATGIVSADQGISINPPVPQAPATAFTVSPLFNSNSTWTGRFPFTEGGPFVYYHQIIINDHTRFDRRGSVGFREVHKYGGIPNTSGSRVAMAVDVVETPGFPTLGGFGSGFNNQTIAFQPTALAGENAGGTSLTTDGVAGGVYSIATYARLLGTADGYATGATNYLDLQGMNMNIAAHAGTSTINKSFIVMSNEDGDVVQGTLTDAAIVLASNTANTVGLKNYLAAGRAQGAWPMDPAGNLWGIYRGSITRALTVAYGLNWKDIYFPTAAIATPGFKLDGQGNVSSGAAILSTSGNTTTLSVSLIHVVSSAVISSSGTWNVGDSMYDASNNQWQAATVDGSNNLLTVTPVALAYISGPAPTNPVAVTKQAVGIGGASLTLGWSSPNLLQVIPGGTTNLLVGTGAALATNATTGLPLFPTTTGAPTGTVGAAGQAAYIVRTDNHRICHSEGAGTWYYADGSACT